MPRPSRQPRALLAAATTATATAALLVAGLSPASPAEADRNDAASAERRRTVIKVNTTKRAAKVSASLLGVNHRYTRNGFGLWNADAGRDGRPDRRIVRHMRRVGIESLRYPGGTTATMYDWRRGIGAERECQIEGHGNKADGFEGLRRGLTYGPDEYMEVIDASGTRPIIMAPFVNSSPREAAGWVEYMNARVGTNPGGGKAWARVRAKNGHRAPYGVHTWEVGNESHVAPIRYLFARKKTKAVKQYANGGQRIVRRERLGKRCAHPPRGAQSNGRKHQRFETIYTPATVRKLTVGAHRWRKVSERELGRVAQGARVYSWDRRTGTATFGGGGHGRAPRKGAVIRASYRNQYAGFFAFARRMHRIDPRIRVCATWGTPLFADAARARDYDCQSAHPITNFGKTRRWRDRLEGHDRMMLGLAESGADVRAVRRAQPRGTPLLLTEFQPIKGWDAAYRHWSASMSNAVYMGSQWTTWLRLGIQWGNGGDLLGHGPGAVFGSPQESAFSVEAVVRRAIEPMFRAHGRVVRTRVRHNPVRDPDLRGVGSYRALSVVASRTPRGQVWLFVVNRAPHRDVRATVKIRGFAVKRRAAVRRVVGNHYTEWNPPGKRRQVHLGTSFRRAGGHRFTMRFPAHSVIMLRMRRR